MYEVLKKDIRQIWMVTAVSPRRIMSKKAITLSQFSMKDINLFLTDCFLFIFHLHFLFSAVEWVSEVLAVEWVSEFLALEWLYVSHVMTAQNFLFLALEWVSEFSTVEWMSKFWAVEWVPEFSAQERLSEFSAVELLSGFLAVEWVPEFSVQEWLSEFFRCRMNVWVFDCRMTLGFWL